jgi:hypothetical protein
MAAEQNPNKNQQSCGGQQGQNAGQKPGQHDQDPGQGQQGRQNRSQKPGQQSQNQDPKQRR